MTEASALVAALAPAALAARGDAIALDAGASLAAASITYAELAGLIAAASRAIAAASPEGARVALVSGGRGVDEPVALLGAIAAGRTFVPLDATSPPARVAAVARRARVALVVSDASAAPLAEAAAEAAGAVRLELDASGVLRLAPAGPPAPLAAHGSDRGVSLGAASRAPAAILHTSGSTGDPKPVPITWAGLEAFTTFTSGLVDLGAGDRVLRVAELVFDLAMFDHLATLSRGATLALAARRDLANGRLFARAADALRPTVVYGVPSLFSKLATPLPQSVRAVFYAGEPFARRELARFASGLASGARVFNLFGPTETNVCTFHELGPEDLRGERDVPIGRPAPYAACTFEPLESLEPRAAVSSAAAAGEPAAARFELVVSGPTVIGGGPHRTGDVVSVTAAGELLFHGRIDRMTKLRGYRVEPREVELAIEATALVRRAAVLPATDERLGKILVAFVEPMAPPEGATPAATDAGGDLEVAVRREVAATLPAYMVPERVVIVGELPHTVTGKIDFQALASRI